MARRPKYEMAVENIMHYLRRELKHHSEEMHDKTGFVSTDEVLQGRFEMARELLNYIKTLVGDKDIHAHHDSDEVIPEPPNKLFDEEALQDAIAYAEKLIIPKEERDGIS